MRTWIPAGVVLLALAFGSAAEAKTPIDRWAARNHLKGAWRTKDKDGDRIKNRREFALKTNPRKADSDGDRLHDGDELTIGSNPLKPDSDGDGIRDGDENAGVITAYDAIVITIKRFHGKPVTADVTEDSVCAGGDASSNDAPVADDGPAPEDDDVEYDSSSNDYVAVTEDAANGDPHWAEPDESADGTPVDDSEPEDVVDLGGDDDYSYAGCEDPRLKPGVLVTSAVIKDGLATEINVKS
jgi:hypothetical protein